MIKNKEYLPLVITLIIILSLTVGCNFLARPEEDNGGPEEPETLTLTLYFRDLTQKDYDSEPFGLVVPVEKKIAVSDNAPRRALEELIKGPEDKDAAGPVISDEAEILDFFIEDGTCVVNLSHEFPLLETGGREETEVFMEAVISTLTEFPEISSVWLFLKGECWEDGHIAWGGPLNRPKNSREIILYFGDEEAIISGEPGQFGFVAPVEREVEWSTDPLRDVMEQLIKGPLPGETSTDNKPVTPSIPEDTMILSLTCPSLEERVVTINLRGADTAGTLGSSIFVRSVVYSLTTFPLVDQVLVQSDGEPWNDGHFTWNEPLGR